MTFQFINNTVVFLLTYGKLLIIINYQSLNYVVNTGCVLSLGPYLQTFTNVTSQ